jgi:molecular chaperone IbpA
METIMNNALSLSPLFRTSVGFDRFNDLFDTLGETDIKTSFPPYDIVKTGGNTYQIIMAIAGYKQSEVTLTLENSTLSIHGKHEETNKEDSTNYLHRGIAKRSFERTFRLDDNMKVEEAGLTDGLLTVSLKREIPEEKKPKIIPINEEKNTLEQH